MTAGITFDAGELIALDRDDRQVPWRRRSADLNGQVRLARLIRQPKTDVVPLDRVDATNVGRLLTTSGTTDVVDAHIVICARRLGQRAITSDPDDLRRLNPHLDVVTV